MADPVTLNVFENLTPLVTNNPAEIATSLAKFPPPPDPALTPTPAGNNSILLLIAPPHYGYGCPCTAAHTTVADPPVVVTYVRLISETGHATVSPAERLMNCPLAFPTRTFTLAETDL